MELQATHPKAPFFIYLVHIYPVVSAWFWTCVDLIQVRPQIVQWKSKKKVNLNKKVFNQFQFNETRLVRSLHLYLVQFKGKYSLIWYICNAGWTRGSSIDIDWKHGLTVWNTNKNKANRAYIAIFHLSFFSPGAWFALHGIESSDKLQGRAQSVCFRRKRV